VGKRLIDTRADSWPEIRRKFLEGTNDEVRELSRELGYKRTDVLYKSMRRKGVIREYKPDKAAKTPATYSLDELERHILDIVKKRPVSVGEISRQIDRSSETVIKLLDSLRAKHFMVELDNVSRLVELPAEPRRDFAASEFKYFHNYYKIGLLSDTHLGSKYQQLSLLYDAHKIFDERDVDVIFHAGDLLDGTGMYREHIQESFLHTAKEQREYAEEMYPKPKKEKLKTHLIGGQHDRSFYKREGYDILEHFAEHRDDIVYHGFFSHEFHFKELRVRLEHPGGGLAYARSYSAQKIVENMMGFINTIPSAQQPAFLIMGHWHTPLHLPVYMGVDTACLPCFQAQTPYMQQRKNMMPTIGCAIAEIYMNEDGQLSSVKIEFIVMNDKVKEKDW
jgi:predicted phosphodiesterase/biotin operon repressor